MSDLFTDLFADILIRLPVKSLIRFRCISKPICSQIDSPHFNKLHLNHSTLTSSDRNIVIPHGVGFKLYSLNPHSHTQDYLILNPFMTQDSVARVMGSCNGLLCLYDSRQHIMIWNPATRKHLNLPSPPPNTFLHTSNISYGFGYDSHHDDCKLLIIDIYPIHNGRCNCRLYVYSMKLNLWRPVSGWFLCDVQARIAGIFVSGALHFIGDLDDRFDIILAFDLAAAGEEECRYREVPRPPEVPRPRGAYLINLGALEGCLSSSYIEGGYVVSVWVMKEYGVVESWTKLLSLRNDRLSPKEVIHFKPLATCNGGAEVILEDDACSLVRYDLKRKRLRSLRLPGRPYSFDSAVYTESLVNPVPITSPDDGRDITVLSSD